MSYVCDITHCSEVSLGLKQFIVHLREHVKNNTTVNCPFENCKKKFGVVESTFNSRISRYHRHVTHVSLKQQYIASTTVVQASNGLCDIDQADEIADSESGSCVEEVETIEAPRLSQVDMEKMMLKKNCTFIIKLEGQTSYACCHSANCYV